MRPKSDVTRRGLAVHKGVPLEQEDCMRTTTTPERKPRVEELRCDLENARADGMPSSKYFLEKCDSEAGFDLAQEAPRPAGKPARSPWTVLFERTWIARFLRTRIKRQRP